MFKQGSDRHSSPGRAKPEGGYGSYGTPSKAMRKGGSTRGGSSSYTAGRELGKFKIGVPKSQRRP